MKSILFVDDETRILDGLKRMLRSLRREWKMTFVDTGAAALSHLDAEYVDVVVTDMRMPGMDGSELLQEARVRYPGTVRIILSGQCDRDSVFQCLGPAHQFLTKPCDSESLKATVARACKLRDHLPNTWSKRLVSGVQSLPSLPVNHEKLRAEARSEAPCTKRFAKIVNRDPAMAAKVLQLVNSGFFGTPRRVSDPVQAVNLLGLDILKPLILSTDVFLPLSPDNFHHPQFEKLVHRSLLVAQAAKAIAESETEDATIIHDAWLGGLAGNVGILMLLETMGDKYVEAMESACHEELCLAEIEKRTLNMTHDSVGAYLLGLWGLPDPIVKAVAWHLDPCRDDEKQFGPLTAVHVANALVEEHPVAPPDPLDMNYLIQIGCEDRLDAWRALCRGAVLEGANP